MHRRMYSGFTLALKLYKIAKSYSYNVYFYNTRARVRACVVTKWI